MRAGAPFVATKPRAARNPAGCPARGRVRQGCPNPVAPPYGARRVPHGAHTGQGATRRGQGRVEERGERGMGAVPKTSPSTPPETKPEQGARGAPSPPLHLPSPSPGKGGSVEGGESFLGFFARNPCTPV